MSPAVGKLKQARPSRRSPRILQVRGAGTATWIRGSAVMMVRATAFAAAASDASPIRRRSRRPSPSIVAMASWILRRCATTARRTDGSSRPAHPTAEDGCKSASSFRVDRFDRAISAKHLSRRSISTVHPGSRLCSAMMRSGCRRSLRMTGLELGCSRRTPLIADRMVRSCGRPTAIVVSGCGAIARWTCGPHRSTATVHSAREH